MATYDMLNAARVVARGKRAPGTFDGNVKVLSDRYTFTTGIFSASDFLSLGYLPAGARVIDAGISCASTGTTGMFTLGTVVDPDGFCTTADTGGQAAVKKSSTEALIGSQMAVETQVILDCSEATDVATDVVLEAYVVYVMESIE